MWPMNSTGGSKRLSADLSSTTSYLAASTSTLEELVRDAVKTNHELVGEMKGFRQDLAQSEIRRARADARTRWIVMAALAAITAAAQIWMAVG